MERAVEIFAAINFLVMGASHVVRPHEWKAFFTALHERGAVGNFFNAMLALGMGSLIVAFHPSWDGIVPALLNLYGWAAVVKAAVFLIFPAVGIESLAKPMRKDPRLFLVPGTMLIALGTALLIHPHL